MPANRCPTIRAAPFAAKAPPTMTARTAYPVGAGHAREPMPDHPRGPIRGQGPSHDDPHAPHNL